MQQTMKRLGFGLLIGLLVVFIGCSKKTETQQPSGNTEPTVSEQQPPAGVTGSTETAKPEGSPAPAGDVAVSGRVIFKGTPPQPRPVSFGGEVQCAAIHKDQPLYSEDMVVGEDGGLQWALVYVKEGVTGEFKAPNELVVMDQVGCQFIPHVIAVMPKQLVEFRNSDPLLHNVRANCKVNRTFNVAQPKQGQKTIQRFEKPEIGISIRCDVHAWMASYIHVVPHPYFAITDEKGNFSIKGLPPGSYTLEVWHERLGTQSAKAEVKEGAPATVDFTFEK